MATKLTPAANLTAGLEGCEDGRTTEQHEIKRRGGCEEVEIDRDEVVSQEETGEPAEVDAVEGRVEAEMKRIEGQARESVGQGLQDSALEEEGRRLAEEGERELEKEREKES